jgi:hypothetical protein
MIFYVGDVWKPKVTWRDPETKAIVEPTTTTAKVTAPDLTVTGPTPSKVETGIWRASVKLTEAGKWHIVFNATGAYEGAKPETITVLPT